MVRKFNKIQIVIILVSDKCSLSRGNSENFFKMIVKKLKLNKI